MDDLQYFLDQVGLTARHLFSDSICGLSPTHYTGSVGYIHFFRGGKLTVIPSGAEQFVLEEPTIIFYPGAWAHRLHGDETETAQLLCSVVDSRTGMKRAVSAVLPRVLVIPIAKAPKLQTILNLLVNEADAKKPGWRLACDRLFDYLIADIIRWAIETGEIDQSTLSGFGDPRLARSLTALHEDMARNWTLDSLAAMAGMSRSAYAERFAETMGMTPAKYILNLRISTAKNLLARGMPVKAASTEVGFTGAAVFARAFRRHTGQSPSEWLGKAGSAD